MVNGLYSVINIVCLLLFGMILIKERQSHKISNRKLNLFYLLIWGIIVFCVVDCFWGLIAAKVIKTKILTFYYLTIVLYILISIVSSFWMIYVDSELSGKIIKSKPALLILYLPVIAAIVMLCTNRYTGLVIKQESFFVFIHKPLWYFVEGAELFYYLIAISECAIVYFKDKEHSNKVRAFFGFCILPITAFIFKLFYMEIPCKCISYMLSCVFIYMFNSTEETLALNIKLVESNNFKKIAANQKILDAITNSYACIYLFNTKTGEPLTLRTVEKVEKVWKTVKDNDKIFSEVVKHTTHPDYVEKMLLFTNIVSLEQRMEGKQIISQEFKGSENEWCRANWIRVEEDEEGFLSSAIYAILNIDEEKKKELEFQQKLKTALENQNEIYAEILQMQSNGILVTDMHDRILTVNETALKLFNMDNHESMDSSLFDIMTKYLKDKKDYVIKKIHTIKVRGGYFTFEFIIDKSETEDIYVVAESKLAKTSLGEKILITSFMDITKNKKVENDLVLLSETDSLTKINNRGSGARKIEFLLGKEKGGMLCIFDADKFKSINDNYGHIAGDKVLIAIAECMTRVFRDKDVIMRLGGDEFAIYAVGVTDKESGIPCIERFLDEINKVKIKELNNNPITISVGAVFCTEFASRTFDDYYQMADKAMYRSKRYTGHHFEFFE